MRTLRCVLPLIAVLTVAACVPAPPPTPPPADIEVLGYERTSNIPAPAWHETSDPTVLVHEGQYYLYGSDNHLRAPVTITDDIDGHHSLWAKNALTFEAMPTKPAWSANERQTWAPTVGRFPARPAHQQWVMFFAADRVNPPQPHNAQCIGRAFAEHPSGPFTPEPHPWHCGLHGGQGGALDPELFEGPDGRRWLLMAFSDTNTPLHSAPLNHMGAVDTTVANPVRPILGRTHPWQEWFLENPTMLHDPHRRDFILAYSAGRWFTSGYTTGFARCDTPHGPCRADRDGSWIRSGAGRSGPGGLTFFEDVHGTPRAIFATFAAGGETQVGGRSASTARVVLTPRVRLLPCEGHLVPAERPAACRPL